MTSTFDNINDAIHKEADALLNERGLLPILQEFGTPHVTGSYALSLMTWRDLDIYLETGSITEEDFFRLGAKINATFSPVKMSYRNERLSKTEGLPVGLYWGIYLGNERKGEWKIDLWALDPLECERRIKFCDDIAHRLTPSSRAMIMGIKSECWKDPDYRRSYTSRDIYEAVFSGKAKNIQEFKQFLRASRA